MFVIVFDVVVSYCTNGVDIEKNNISIFRPRNLQYPCNVPPSIKMPEPHTLRITAKKKKTLVSKKEKTLRDGSGPGMIDSYGARERRTFVKWENPN